MINWKVGDRVRFNGNDGENLADVGTVTSIDEDGKVWAKWDSDGESLHFMGYSSNFTKISSAPDSETGEQEAVMLLLSLGYTLTKRVDL